MTWLVDNKVVRGDGYSDTLTAFSSSSQTATLLVKGTHVTEDKDYVCRVASGEYSQSPPQKTVVRLLVYGKRLHLLHYLRNQFIGILKF